MHKSVMSIYISTSVGFLHFISVMNVCVVRQLTVLQPLNCLVFTDSRQSASLLLSTIPFFFQYPTNCCDVKLRYAILLISDFVGLNEAY